MRRSALVILVWLAGTAPMVADEAFDQSPPRPSWDTGASSDESERIGEAGESVLRRARGSHATADGAPAWEAADRVIYEPTAHFAHDAFGETIAKTTRAVASLDPLTEHYESTDGGGAEHISGEGRAAEAERIGATTQSQETDRQEASQAIINDAAAIIEPPTDQTYSETSMDATSSLDLSDRINPRRLDMGIPYLHASYPALATFLSPGPVGPQGGLNSDSSAFGNPDNDPDDPPRGRPWWAPLVGTLLDWIFGGGDKIIYEIPRPCLAIICPPQPWPPPENPGNPVITVPLPSDFPPTDYFFPPPPQETAPPEPPVVGPGPGPGPPVVEPGPEPGQEPGPGPGSGGGGTSFSDLPPTSFADFAILGGYVAGEALSPSSTDAERFERAQGAAEAWRWLQEQRGLLIDFASLAAAVPGRGLPRFPDLLGHASRHSSLTRSAYYARAVEHMSTGQLFTFRHGGEFRHAYLTRTGPDSFTFTSTSLSGRTIFTHINGVRAQYLSNIGITLPRGF